MVFSSLFFVLVFLPIVFSLYYIAEKTKSMLLKNTVVLVASLFFYAWGGLNNFILLIVLIILNYCLSLLMQTKLRTLFFLLCVAMNIMVLIYYKYLNFIFENSYIFINDFLGIQIENKQVHVDLPIGISFFTFQIISYIVDVYRKSVPIQRNIFKLGLYVMMFPQLIAGPIVRYIDINNMINERTTSHSDAESGIRRFIIGLAKKVFIANTMGSIADVVFVMDPTTTNFIYLWLGALCYTLQIFFDFSGYSDMAIGLGKVFGFTYKENFNYPYVATSIQDFWRRWHISLSSWFRDYVYIPLGGSRCSKSRTIFNCMVVFALTGIWHGAEWHYMLWGCFHGAFLILERLGLSKLLAIIPKYLQHLYALIIVVIGWVLFRADTAEQCFTFVRGMFTLSFDNILDGGGVNVLPRITYFVVFFFVVGWILSFSSLSVVRLKIKDWFRDFLIIALFLLTVIYLSGVSYNPFIYFKF